MSTLNNIFSLVNANKSNLFPILPPTIRDSSLRVSRTIVPGLAPSFQFEGWTIFARPARKHYAHTRAREGITIITEARVVEPDVSDQLNAWLAIIFSVITEKDIHLPESSHLFLEIRQDLCACNYYFVDHVRRTVFWLHTLDIIGIGPPRTFSIGHLRHSLQENYWLHVERFPETASEYSAAALDNFNDLLLHARTDVLALGSPALWLLESLQRNKNGASTPHTTTCVARLWATVENHRSSIAFGNERCLVLTIVSKILLFGFPDEHLARFESLCVDQLVYTSRWHNRVSETIGDLKQEVKRILAFLSANIFMMQISSFPALTILSLTLCALGLTVALFLLQEQRRIVGKNSTTSAVNLGRWVTGYGFQPIAVVYSLPQALFVWALILFTIQHFLMGFFKISLSSLLITSLFVVAVLKAVAEVVTI